MLSCLTHAKKLRSLHLNYPLELHPNSPTIITPTIALDIVQRCSPTLRQFGFNTKVWQVSENVILRPVFIYKESHPLECAGR